MIKEKDLRLTITDIEFDSIFDIFPLVDEVSISLFSDKELGIKDLENAKRYLEIDYQNDLQYYKDIYKDKFDELYSVFLEDIKRTIETLIKKEIIMNDTSLSLKERFNETRKFFNERRLHIDDDDIPLYQLIYDYEFKKEIINRYIPKKDINAMRFLDMDLSELKPFIYRYEIFLEAKSFLRPKYIVRYFFKLNEESKKTFISYEDGERINITEYALYHNDRVIFIYDYGEMMYYKDGEWLSISGTLAN